MAKKPPMMPGMGSSGANPFNRAGLKPKNSPPGRSGAKKGMPNFRSRITKPGGLASGGMVASGAGASRSGKANPTGGAGQGSGMGRLKMSK